ncbi:MAG: aromatic ring-hydroxylating dioxygenase subunit alpha, partial [Armatimonadetes bacterium]|nr:aromatic ring-hydroxylating dioxygenase subunit alpha [Armatimonadota bacterium]
LGLPLVLFRDDQGRAAALPDRCAHRSAPLSRGRVQQGCLECPYHGWRYNSAGECVHIPALTGPPPRRRQLPLAALPTLERDGFIWVYPGSQALPPEPFRFPHLGESGWHSFRMVTRFPAPAFLCVENFLDCPHTVFVHQGWFRSRRTREVHARVRRGADWVEAEFAGERDAESVVSRTLFPGDQEMIHTDRFQMPAITRVDYGFGTERHFIITSQCTPVGPRETLVYTVMTYRFRRLGPLVRLFFEPLSRHVIRQDVAILRAVADNLERFERPGAVSLSCDLLGPQIWDMWRRARHRAPPAPQGEWMAWLKF